MTAGAGGAGTSSASSLGTAASTAAASALIPAPEVQTLPPAAIALARSRQEGWVASKSIGGSSVGPVGGAAGGAGNPSLISTVVTLADGTVFNMFQNTEEDKEPEQQRESEDELKQRVLMERAERVCRHCKELLWMPVRLPDCRHALCLECFERTAALTLQCPLQDCLASLVRVRGQTKKGRKRSTSPGSSVSSAYAGSGVASVADSTRSSRRSRRNGREEE